MLQIRLARILLLSSVVFETPLTTTASSPPDEAQKPLFSSENLPAEIPATLENEPNQQQWTLNFSSSAPHLFASTYSLLQQWSNTMFPNGHALAPVEVPAYTLFYHGRMDADLPPSPEWLAFDLEMSYGIMGSSRSSFLLTYQTVRPVRALYFDGESAALMGLGQLDSQLLHLFGNISGPAWDGDGGGFRGLWEEYLRARGLCDWLLEKGLRGPGWGFEGVVRMNAGFEMIWCDFMSGSLRLLTRLNVTAPQLPEEEQEQDRGFMNMDEDSESEPDLGWELRGRVQMQGTSTSYYSLPPLPTKTDRATDPSDPPLPPNWRQDRTQEPFLRSQAWGWFDSATWHYGSSRSGPGLGEARAKVLSCGVLSYYSPQFVNQSMNRALEEHKTLNLTDDGLWKGEGNAGNRTIAIKQLARRRRFHHLGDVIPEEAALMRQNSEIILKNLLQNENDCTGADWTLITSEIVQRMTNQLTMMDTKLASAPTDLRNKTAVRDWMFELRAQSHMFLVGFLEYPSEINEKTWATQSLIYNDTYARCRYRYTRLLVPEEGASLYPQEQDILWAIEETYGTICTVLITVGFGIERSWLEAFVDKNQVSSRALGSQVATWQDNIAELTAWLGWESEYYGCKETCSWDERCFIPMWPLLSRKHFGGGGPERGPPGNGTRPDKGRGPPGGDGHGGPPGRDHPLNDRNAPPKNGREPGRGYGRPDFKMPPRGPWWMGDDSDLWEPKCVKQSYIMG